MCVYRSFSELYQKSIQDAESKSGEGQSGEAWVLDEREQENEESREELQEMEEEEREQGEGEESVSIAQPDGREAEEEESDEAGQGGGSTCLLSTPSLPLLRAASLQDSPLPQGMEVTPSPLTRSYSLERHPPFQDICDGYTHTYTHFRLVHLLRASLLSNEIGPSYKIKLIYCTFKKKKKDSSQ